MTAPVNQHARAADAQRRRLVQGQAVSLGREGPSHRAALAAPRRVVPEIEQDAAATRDAMERSFAPLAALVTHEMFAGRHSSWMKALAHLVRLGAAAADAARADAARADADQVDQAGGADA